MRRALTRRAATALTAAIVVALALGALPARAASSIEDYASRLQAAADAVSTAMPEVGDASGAEELAAHVRSLLPEGEEVIAGERTITLDDSTLARILAELEGASSASARRDAAEKIASHVASLAAAVGVPSGEVTPSDAAALSRIIEEERVGDTGMPSWLSELEQRIRDWLADLLPKLLPDVPEPVYKWILPTMSALAVLLAVFLVWRLWRKGVIARHHVEALEDGVAGKPVVAVAEGLPDDVLAYADAAASENRYRDAVRALFGGAARSLGEHGVVSRTRTRTTAELLRDVAGSRDGLSCSLAEIAAVFEPAWYGHRDPGGTGFASARAAYVSFSAMLEAGDVA
jgi:hypothetical protein